MSLPPFPTDPQSLALLRDAITITEGSERTSLDELLVLMSQMGGSDTTAVESVDRMPHPFTPGESVDVEFMRDQQYHPNDVIRALVDEIEVLRAALDGDS